MASKVLTGPGGRIKTVRRQRGLSQAQLAHPELSDSYVSLIESGKRVPTPSVLELLAEKLDCSLSYLVSGVNAEQREQIELSLQSARTALDSGETDRARAEYAALVADDVLVELPALRREAELGLADAMQSCRQWSEAIELLTRIRERDARVMSAQESVSVACALSRCYRHSGDLTRAVLVAEEMVDGSVRPAWSDGLVRLGVKLLAAYIERGDLLRGSQFCGELLVGAELVGDASLLASVHRVAALLAVENGRGTEAIRHVERAIVVYGDAGDPGRLRRLRSDRARIVLSASSVDTASVRTLVKQMEAELADDPAASIDAMRCVTNLVNAELLRGRTERAAEHVTALLRIAEGLPEEAAVEARLSAGRALVELERPRDAMRELTAVAEWLARAPATPRTARMWLAVAQALERIEEPARSVDAYRRALACVGV
ncbi:helix-turn-helix domain-containing protein [Streptosporangium subroseum]|uniref:helix-turn-helix domain-containing protein n=1 Tax=Streptosporangium subroseum TaxID=106412 RepID=UPI001FEBC550|nr:helix-turn-helix transcriptional regulator [Streptosporangium subroseum]